MNKWTDGFGRRLLLAVASSGGCVADRRGVTGIARAVADEAIESDLSFVASGLAYYSLMAVTPALVVGFLLLVELGGEALAAHVVDRTTSVLSASGQRFIRESMAQMNARSGVSVIRSRSRCGAPDGSTTGWIRASSGSTASAATAVDGARDAARVLALGGLGTTGVVGLAVAASLYADGGVGRLAAAPFTFVVTLVVAYPILNGMAPDLARVESLPGALFTAMGWTVGAGVVGSSPAARLSIRRYTACSGDCCSC